MARRLAPPGAGARPRSRSATRTRPAAPNRLTVTRGAATTRRCSWVRGLRGTRASPPAVSRRRRHQRLGRVLRLDRLCHRHRRRLIEQSLRERERERRQVRQPIARSRACRFEQRSWATTRFTSPMRSASVASITSARNTSSLARCMPTSRGSTHEPPKSTTSPRFEKISLKRARSDATIRSQPEREIAAGARGDSVDRRDRRLRPARAAAARPGPRCASRPAPRPARGARRRSPLSPRSAPEQNPSPAPVITSTRSSRFSATSSNSSVRPSHISPVIAFFLAGRFSVHVTTPSARSMSRDPSRLP